MTVTLVFLLCVCSIAQVSGQIRTRAPRLFFVSSTTTTSTVSTSTYCWYSGTNAITTTCTGRRKRSILAQPGEKLELLEKISPAPLTTDEEEVESGLSESERDGRFLLYWITTTSTSTTTSFTGTSTIA